MNRRNILLFVIIAFIFIISGCKKDNNSPTQYCTVTFNSNGGTSVESQQVEKGSPVSIVEDPTREGFTFDAWYYGREKWSFKSDIVLIDMTLDATWIANKYQVIFDLDGGEGITDTTIEVKYNSYITLPTPTKTGHTFLGWYDGDTKVETGYWTIAKDTTLVAKYELNIYTLNLLLDGGTVEGQIGSAQIILEVSYGSNITLPTPTKTGYTFIGWFNGDKEVVSGVWDTLSDSNLFAKYTPNKYTITLNLNGGTGISKTTIEVLYDADFTLPTPTREGYSFDGWYNGESKVENGIWKHDGNITLIAKWQINQYTINYYINNELYKTYIQEYNTVITSPKIPLYYNFDGWYVENQLLSDEMEYKLEYRK